MPGGQTAPPGGSGGGHNLLLAPSRVLLSGLEGADRACLSAVEMVASTAGALRLPYREVKEHTPYVTERVQFGELFVPLADGAVAWFATTLVVIGEARPGRGRPVPAPDEEALRAQATAEIQRRLATGVIPAASLTLR